MAGELIELGSTQTLYLLGMLIRKVERNQIGVLSPVEESTGEKPQH